MSDNLVLMRMPLGSYGTNCYVLGDTSVGKAFIIDPGTSEVMQSLEKHELTPEAILLTHGHHDHIGGIQGILKDYNIPVYIHKADADYLHNPALNLSEYSASPIRIDGDIRLVKEGDTLNCGDITVNVLETPGHTPGGVCYIMEGLIFAGDTLFRDSIGRTDFDGGDYDTLIQAIQNKLYTLPESTMVYPGHGPETQISYEKQYNPFVTA